MKKKMIITLSAMTMLLSSTNAFAFTKTDAKYLTSNLESMCKSYIISSFNNNECVSDIMDRFNLNWDCIFNDCKNESPDKPETETPDIPETEKPDAPETESPDIPEIEIPEIEVPETQKPVNPDNSQNNNTNNNQNNSSSESAYISEVVRLVNVERAKEGLSALKSDSLVQSAAQVRAMEIVSSFSHTRPDGRDCFTALAEAGVRYSGAGENIAYGQRTPAEVVQAWMNSPGHRANIMNGNFTTIGVGCYKSGNTYYWSQFFTR